MPPSPGLRPPSPNGRDTIPRSETSEERKAGQRSGKRDRSAIGNPASRFTSNKAIKDGPKMLAGDEVITTAILDRLLYACHVLKGGQFVTSTRKYPFRSESISAWTGLLERGMAIIFAGRFGSNVSFFTLPVRSV